MNEIAAKVVTDVQQQVMEAARQRRAHVLELKEQGFSNKQIQGMLGVTKQRVSTMLKQARKDKKTRFLQNGVYGRRCYALAIADAYRCGG